MHLLTQSALLRALGWSLFNSLWQMSLLWAFYHLFLLIFKQLPARARHGLALLLLTTGSCWSAITFITLYTSAGDPLTISGQPGMTGVLSGGLMGSSLLTAHGLRTLLIVMRSLVLEILPWCSSLYLLILVGLLVHYSRQYIRSRRIIREGLTPLAPEFGVFVARAGGSMGIRATVSAYLSSLVQVPMTLGFLKPVILLPVAMVTQLTTAQIEAILIHELAHIRRKDYLLNLLTTLLELLFFFNPFTRLLIGQLKKEREHCCDEAVLEYRYDPHGYVSALLSLARQQQHPGLAVAAIGGGGEQLLLQRARKILQQKRTDDRPGPRPLIGLLLTAAVSLLLFGHMRPTLATRLQTRRSVALLPVSGGFQSGQSQSIPEESQPGQTQINPGGFQPGQLGPNPAILNRPIPAIGQQHVVALETMSVVIIRSSVPPPPPVAPRAVAVPSHRHPARLHTKRSAEELLEAMLTESVPVLNTAGPADMPAPVFADLMETAQRADRDFSMGKSNAAPQDGRDPATGNSPFVPESSFSFQYTDTLPPDEKLALMQELSRNALILEIARLEQELKQQMIVLHAQETAVRNVQASESHSDVYNKIDIKSLQDLLQQQLQVQQQYFLHLEKLQRQLQKASPGLMIVYI